jgi:hypothetical protein
MRNAEFRMRNLKGVIGLCFVLLFAGAVFADAPSDIIVKYDHKDKTLTIEAMHGSRDVKSHYIREVRVSVNGELVINQKSKLQYDVKKQLFKFIMADVKEGDKIEVSADCNIFGSLKKSIEIKAPVPEGVKKAPPAK